MGSDVWDKVPNKYGFFLTPSLIETIGYHSTPYLVLFSQQFSYRTFSRYPLQTLYSRRILFYFPKHPLSINFLYDRPNIFFSKQYSQFPPLFAFSLKNQKLGPLLIPLERVSKVKGKCPSLGLTCQALWSVEIPGILASDCYQGIQCKASVH